MLWTCDNQVVVVCIWNIVICHFNAQPIFSYYNRGVRNNKRYYWQCAIVGWVNSTSSSYTGLQHTLTYDCSGSIVPVNTYPIFRLGPFMIRVGIVNLFGHDAIFSLVDVCAFIIDAFWKIEGNLILSFVQQNSQHTVLFHTTPGAGLRPLYFGAALACLWMALAQMWLWWLVALWPHFPPVPVPASGTKGPPKMLAQWCITGTRETNKPMAKTRCNLSFSYSPFCSVGAGPARQRAPICCLGTGYKTNSRQRRRWCCGFCQKRRGHRLTEQQANWWICLRFNAFVKRLCSLKQSYLILLFKICQCSITRGVIISMRW